jgi:hypothetical protein
MTRNSVICASANRNERDLGYRAAASLPIDQADASVAAWNIKPT